MNLDDIQNKRTTVFQNFKIVLLGEAGKWIMTECAKFDVGKVIKTYIYIYICANDSKSATATSDAATLEFVVFHKASTYDPYNYPSAACR